MAKRIRIGGPVGVVRPYSTMPATDEPIEQIAQALDHIAVALSAMDHNLEHATHLLQAIAVKQGAVRP
ncbi:MAG: hypothetical protein WD099_01530 [Dongiaceae bacterium]